MTDIWVVTVGEYSELSVDCAFENEEDAKRYCFEQNANKVSWEATYSYQRTDFNPPLPSVVAAVVQKKEPPTLHEVLIEPYSPSGHPQHVFFKVRCKTCGWESALGAWTETTAKSMKLQHIREKQTEESE